MYLHKRLRRSWGKSYFEDRKQHSEFDTGTKLLKMISNVAITWRPIGLWLMKIEQECKSLWSLRSSSSTEYNMVAAKLNFPHWVDSWVHLDIA